MGIFESPSILLYDLYDKSTVYKKPLSMSVTVTHNLTGISVTCNKFPCAWENTDEAFRILRIVLRSHMMADITSEVDDSNKVTFYIPSMYGTINKSLKNDLRGFYKYISLIDDYAFYNTYRLFAKLDIKILDIELSTVTAFQRILEARDIWFHSSDHWLVNGMTMTRTKTHVIYTYSVKFEPRRKHVDECSPAESPKHIRRIKK